MTQAGDAVESFHEGKIIRSGWEGTVSVMNSDGSLYRCEEDSSGG